VKNGWLESADSGETYQVTTTGRGAKDAIESLTDKYFYSPWKVLTSAELEELHDRLKQLQSALASKTN
jgi:hypothetical protein